MNSFLHTASGYAQLFWPEKNALIWQDTNPVRAELFSVERLEQHAISLATEQRVLNKKQSASGWRDWQSPLHTRLDSNATVLLAAYRASAAELAAGHTIVPAAEWLLDNYHVVDQQIREIYDDLPVGFYRQLPKLQQGPFVGYPRVFAIAWAFIAHTDSHFDPVILQRFLNAYQQVDVLTIGELWAVAITLRIVLIENLRRLTDQITLGLTDRAAADQLADQLLQPDTSQQALHSYISGMSGTTLSHTFAAQLAKRLRGQDPHSTPALHWLEQRLLHQRSSIELVVFYAQQRLGASNVSVRNVMTSMRRISAIDWSELFEQVSLVDRYLCQHSTSALCQDLSAPSAYAAMDFASRNLYRSAIEQLARGADLSEFDVARAAAETALSAEAGEDPVQQAREADPGYYLIGAGRLKFEHRIGFKPASGLKLHRALATIGLAGYLSTLAVLTLTFLALASLLLSDYADYTLWWLMLIPLALLPASELASTLLQCFITRSKIPSLLPALDLTAGVPAALRTLVVVPCMLSHEADVQELVSRLEVHYLSCGGGDLSFVLLTDGLDAAEQELATDQPLLLLASQLIAQLNQSYPSGPAGPAFLLLHRRRLWNKQEQLWMGWERKRGKLVELNLLLRGATNTSFMDGSVELPLLSNKVPTGVRYVITLDADTQLPRDAAVRMVAKLAHPLNRAQFCPEQQRVISGYGLLQPRVTPALACGQQGSAYQQLYSGPAGLDPYAAAVSDLYQDLFAEGSFTGKGIYDVDAFSAAMAGRVADNTMLSHDLFEGIYARAALASDIEVVEDFPARYDVASKRQHRWTRGDWQLLPWLLGCPPKQQSPSSTPLQLPLLGRWKMLDNLRRSLVQPACFILLLLSALLPFPAALCTLLLIASALMLPALLPCSLNLLPHRKGIQWPNHLNNLLTDFKLALSTGLLSLVFLADHSWRMLHAIGITLYRVLLSKKHLLQWTTAAQNQRDSSLTLPRYYGQMSPAILLACSGLGFMLWLNPANWPLFLPLLLLWCAAPAVALALSKPFRIQPALQLSTLQETELRLIARRTWRYFERFVTAEDHMLPPDNFQQQPQPAVAHRTSPTNIGMYLLSVAAARDFGWLTTGQAIQRLEATFSTMKQLRTCHGHLFNWYDTRDLRPLEPVYVSSVDSGNLAGHLIALANACDEWQHQLYSHQARTGLCDNLALAQLSLHQAPDAVLQSQSGLQLQSILSQLDTLLQQSDCLQHQPDPLTELCQQATLIASARQSAPFQRDTDQQISAQHSLVFYLQALQQALAAQLVQLHLPATEQQQQILQLQQLATESRQFAMAMNFAFFIDPERNLLSIGYAVEENRMDTSCYDLLASEARLASLFAIAKGDADSKHWFRLGRSATPLGYGSALLSWSGSMFEYLMPSLVMRAAAGSLLEQSNRLIVERQISYGRQLGMPWGISESAYNARDLEFTYQYSNFGVPGLGLKRGLAENKVIAPYATALATMVDPVAACANFELLKQSGALADYGFFEAIDYTPSRLPDDTSFALVQSFMAHHQGMTIVAIANTLQQGLMRGRFHREPMIQACELLLQERLPRYVAIAHPKAEEVSIAANSAAAQQLTERRMHAEASGPPCSHLLSSSGYAVMLTAAGAGYSRWGNIAITRWREDSSRDPWGAFVLLRDKQSEQIWSSTLTPQLPALASSDQSTFSQNTAPVAIFSEDHAEFSRQYHDLTCTVEVVLSTEHLGEVRRVSLINHSSFSRDIELTSYAEVVLATVNTDNAHPAFAKLFVQTEFVPEFAALVATRRLRSADETAVYAAHFAVVEGEICAPLQYETNRALFFGQGHQMVDAAAMQNKALTNSSGTVLDAIFSLRQSVRIAPGQVCRVAFWTLVASSRQELLDLVDQHNERSAYDRACTLAWTQAQVQLRHLAISVAEAADFQRLTGPLLYNDRRFRATTATITRGAAAQSGLWQHAISGDLPIVLLHIDDIEDLSVVQQLLRAHEYWRMKQLAVDLVIINERAASYVQELQTAIETQVRSSQSKPNLGLRLAGGSVFCLRADLMTVESRALLAAVARVVLYANRGSLATQLSRIPAAAAEPLRINTAQAVRQPEQEQKAEPALQFFNGLGGFSEDGREYHTHMQQHQRPPMPWINVIANPAFGFQVSTLGSGYSWSENSRENQLTPWSNDPVTDPCGEAFYVQDQGSSELISPTAQPINDGGLYTACHGFGYSKFGHQAAGIDMQLLQYVPVADPVKISRLTLTNNSAQTRNLTVTAYTEWVLGRDRSASSAFLQSFFHQDSQAMLLSNPWNTAFAGRIAFAALSRHNTTPGSADQLSGWTADRTEFLGRNGSLASPLALSCTQPLSKRSGAALDPCTALQLELSLAPGERCELVFLLGQSADSQSATDLVRQYQQLDLHNVLQQVWDFWQQKLNAVQVKTPDPAMNIMLNGWLLYQTIVCRLYARAAFYQASGAYGFRDQLQDSMALSFADPAFARQHLLKAAGRQFIEGDVQHWWLPHSGAGVRSRICDDKVWLVFACASYIQSCGDRAVLTEQLPFLQGPALTADQHDAFYQPMPSDHSASLFEHCARGLDLCIAQTGELGLPLMGSGDWNDGMDLVGAEGKGQSVWLGWLVLASIQLFLPFVPKDEQDRASRWQRYAKRLTQALEQHAWDGEWYKRATFDQGSWLGSKASPECKIDSIAQSWAVLSEAARPDRAKMAMASVDQHLINTEQGLALLFSPPFEHIEPNPGYIKGYPAGLRENGGQYSHAAMWAIFAFAKLDQAEKATELFSMLNPIQHALTSEAVERYQTEPYVVSADIYSVEPHNGRGGWSWYTGAAAWMYRSGIEAILGLSRKGQWLQFAPCIPAAWPGFSMSLSVAGTVYQLELQQHQSAASVTLDGKDIAADPQYYNEGVLQLPLDAKHHLLVWCIAAQPQ
ncbi:GH36-type glycosyl hydrolase domain-containing protein [Rheinheimera soli]|uniref:Cyclic beta-1,2-glucan synthetase n=1 Tax=Rheinheimera soli TaxID=443616 RepID=A0ABU1VY01_9GAMM|nr:glucoamylase family protein [Rheinheimera soli]MDR7120480.1 cyclic beta-1,2-glucan synthetase [Rheinheimera soli]